MARHPHFLLVVVVVVVLLLLLPHQTSVLISKFRPNAIIFKFLTLLPTQKSKFPNTLPY
jgi:hypothetical protein